MINNTEELVTTNMEKAELLNNSFASVFSSNLSSYIFQAPETEGRNWGNKVPPTVGESQNHRMAGVGRDLCGSSSPTLLLKQGLLQQAADDLVQAGPEYLQRRRIHNLPGQPVPVLHHLQREEVLPHVQTELPMLQFVPVAPCPVTGHH